jgi:methyl-accepting chemotaxis protein
LTITRRLQIGFLIMVVLILVSGVVAAFTIKTMSNDDQRELGDLSEQASATASLRDAVASEIDAMRAELLLRSTGALVSGSVEHYLPVINAQIKAVRSTASSPEIGRQLDQIASQALTLDAGAKKAIKMARAGRVMEAVRVSAFEVQPSASALTRSLDGLSTMVQNEREQLRNNVTSRGQNALMLLLVTLAIVTGVGVLMSFYFPRTISKSLGGITARLRQNALDLLSGAGRLAAGAAQTSTAVSQTATTVDEVERATRLSTEKAVAVADSARHEREAALEGREAMDSMVAGMHSIESQMQMVADSVVRLAGQLQSANTVIDTSSDIAEQSNVLAVNAAIEAAKAAEHSRSFGVVADEMHNLARQSKQAVVQVREIIAEIQKAATEVVNSAERSNVAVGQGIAQAARSSDSFAAIVQGAGDAADSLTQVAGSAQQQFTAIEQIVDSIGSIEAATAQVAVSTRQMREQASQLHDMAEELHDMVERRSDSAAEAGSPDDSRGGRTSDAAEPDERTPVADPASGSVGAQV